jgi:hypothetical protein
LTEEERAKEISAGVELPGHKGAYWRFLQRTDIARVSAWVAGEKIRQTDPNDLALATAELVADIVTAVAQNMARREMGKFAEFVLSKAVQGYPEIGIIGIYEFLDTIRERKKTTAIHRTGLHIVKE